MNLALRPYVTAGVALVGAGVIAVTPVAPPPPAIQNHAVQLSAAVEDPVSQWAGIITRTFTESGAIVQAILDNPAPILQQVAANQLVTAQTVGTAFQTVANNLPKQFDPSNPFGLVGRLIEAAGHLQEGDAAAASAAVWQGILSTVFLAFPLASLTQIPAGMAQNFANAVSAAAALPVSLGFSALGVAQAPFKGFSDAATDFSEAMANQDVAQAALALASLPGRVIDLAVNGYPSGDYPRIGGLLGAGGVIQTLITARKNIARAIAPKTEEPEPTDGALTLAKAPEAVESSTTSGDIQTAKSQPAEQPEVVETVRDSSAETAKPTVRNSLVALPGKTGTTTAANKPAAKVASDVRDGISATVNKIGEGVKNAFTKPEKKATSASNDKGASPRSSGDSK